MITIAFIALSFLGGVYVGARWADKLKEIWYAIISQ